MTAHTITPHAPPSGGAAASIRGQVLALFSDGYVRGYVLAVGATGLVFVSPILTGGERAAVTWMLYPLFILGPLVAAFANLRVITDPHERRFWIFLGVSFGLWFAVRLFYAAIPVPAWTLLEYRTADAMYLAYYVPILLAIRGVTRGVVPAGPGRLAAWIRPAAITTTMLGWAVYGVLLPATSGRLEALPGWLTYVVLDLVVVGSLAGALRHQRSPRWKPILSWLLGAFGLAALFDGAEAFSLGRYVNWGPDSAAPLLWAVPQVAFVLAIRLRDHLPPGRPATTAEGRDRPAGTADTTMFVLSAFSLPVVHTAAMVMGIVQPGIAVAQDRVVGVVTLVLGVLAAAHYHVIEVARTYLARERGDLERALLQTQKMEAIGRLSGGIAHDYNNLLIAIGGYSDMVIESLPESDPTAGAMKHVRTAVEQASALTRQLLVFSRRQLLKAESVDVNETIRDFPHAHRHLLREQTILHLDLTPDVAPVWVDPTQFEQVLLNLVVNGRDAMPDGGTVRISTSDVELGDGTPDGWPESKPGRYVRVAIADAGVGIPADVMPQIFEPFFTTKPVGRGTGLGLALVYGIVRQTGGRIGVETALGKGTTFEVDLPAAARRETFKPAAALRSDAKGSETILLVEDELSVRELVRSMLTMGGYRLLVAGSGEEALQVAARHRGHIDLLFTDVVMPGMNGRELSERLVRQRPDTRVLFMTGYTDDAVVRHGVLDGAVTLLPKPFTRHALLEIVRTVLDRPDGVAAKPEPGPGGVS